MRRQLFVAAFAAAAFTLLSPTASLAQIEQVTIGVDGLTCNLCAAGLERSLRQVAGVASVTIALEEETALVRLKKDAAFDADALRTAVGNAGQQARALELQLTASVERQDGRYWLHLASGSRIAVNRNSAAKLDGYVGQVVRVRARVSSPARSPLELELTDVARK
jgi:copper chaperone CopZ